MTLKTSPQPENRGRTDWSTHLRRAEENFHISNTATRRWGKGLKGKSANRDGGNKSTAAVKKKLEVRDAGKKGHTFSSFVHPPPEPGTQQALQKGLLNSRKASASNFPRNGMTTRSRMMAEKNGQVAHTERAGENLAGGSAEEMEITASICHRLPTYRVSQLNVHPFQILTTQNNKPALAVGTLNISASTETQTGR